MRSLSPRLRAIAELVPRGGVVADIGCDHGLLSEALIKQGLCSRVIAVDISAPALRKTRRRAEQMDGPDRIDARLGDGFAPIAPGEADAAVIAGLSGDTIVGMLQRGGETLSRMQRVVVQPMSRVETVRAALPWLGWRVVREELLREGRRFFFILALEKGAEEAHTAWETEVGWLLLRERHPLLHAYLDVQYAAMKKAERVLLSGGTARSDEALRALRERMRLYEEGIACLYG